MLLWKQAVTDRTQSDVNRILELLEKGWQNFTEDEQSEWRAGMKGALNKSDLLRIQNNVAILNDVLELGLEVFNLGKNLLKISGYAGKHSCMTVNEKSDDTNSISITLTNAAVNNGIWYPFMYLKTGIKYTFSGIDNDADKINALIQVYNISTGKWTKNYARGQTFVAEKGYKYRLFLQNNTGTVYSGNAFFSEIQLEESESASMFEKYSGRDINFPTEQVFNELLSNVSAIREAYCIHSDTPPVPSLPLNTYQKWNDIERILDDVHGILLNNFYYYSGNEIYAGDDTGLLL